MKMERYTAWDPILRASFRSREGSKLRGSDASIIFPRTEHTRWFGRMKLIDLREACRGTLSLLHHTTYVQNHLPLPFFFPAEARPLFLCVCVCMCVCPPPTLPNPPAPAVTLFSLSTSSSWKTSYGAASTLSPTRPLPLNRSSCLCRSRCSARAFSTSSSVRGRPSVGFLICCACRRSRAGPTMWYWAQFTGGVRKTFWGVGMVPKGFFLWGVAVAVAVGGSDVVVGGLSICGGWWPSPSFFRLGSSSRSESEESSAAKLGPRTPGVSRFLMSPCARAWEKPTGSERAISF